MTWAAILNSYFLKLGEDARGSTSESVSLALDRLTEVYWRVCKDTGCTWKPPTLVTLTAVTSTTNKHKITTILGLVEGEILAVDKVYWEGQELLLWNKGRIDQQTLYNTSATGDPDAFSVHEEYPDCTVVKETYISFYPYINTANSTDCYLSYFLRPVKPTINDYSKKCPEFGEEYHFILAELAALDHLRDTGNSKYSMARYAQVASELTKMRDHYVSGRQYGEMISSRLTSNRGISSIHFYGEP